MAKRRLSGSLEYRAWAIGQIREGYIPTQERFKQEKTERVITRDIKKIKAYEPEKETKFEFLKRLGVIHPKPKVEPKEEKIKRTGLAQFYPKLYLKAWEKVKKKVKAPVKVILGKWETGVEKELRIKLEKEIKKPIKEETFEKEFIKAPAGYEGTYPKYIIKKETYSWGEVESKYKAKVTNGKIEYEFVSSRQPTEERIQKYFKERKIKLEKELPLKKRIGYEAGLKLKLVKYAIPVAGVSIIGAELAEQYKKGGVKTFTQLPSRVFEEIKYHPIRTATTVGMMVGLGYLGKQIVSPKPKLPKYDVGVKSYSYGLKERDILLGGKPVKITYTGDLKYFKTKAVAYVVPKGKWGKVKPTKVDVMGEYLISPTFKEKTFFIKGKYEGIMWKGKKPISTVISKFDVRKMLDTKRGVGLGLGYTKKELLQQTLKVKYFTPKKYAISLMKKGELKSVIEVKPGDITGFTPKHLGLTVWTGKPGIVSPRILLKKGLPSGIFGKIKSKFTRAYTKKEVLAHELIHVKKPYLSEQAVLGMEKLYAQRGFPVITTVKISKIPAPKQQMLATAELSYKLWGESGKSLTISAGRIFGKTIKGKPTPPIQQLGIHAVKEITEPVGIKIGGFKAITKQIPKFDFTKALETQLKSVAVKTMAKIPPIQKVTIAETFIQPTTKALITIPTQEQISFSLQKQFQPTRTLQKLQTKQITKQQTKQLQKQKQLQKLQTKQITKQLSMTGVAQTQIQKQQQKQMQKQLQKLQMVTVPPTVTPSKQLIPIIPIILPKIRLDFDIPKRRIIKGRPYTKYTPGYKSMVFKIIGKKPKKVFKRYTGFEIRPLIKGIPFEKYFSPPKPRVKRVRKVKVKKTKRRKKKRR